LQFSVFLHCVVWWLDASVSEDCIAPIFNTEDGGNMILQNVGMQPPHHIVQQSRKSWFISSQPWKPQILQYH